MSFTETWAKASADENAPAPPPEPGTYDCTLTDAKAVLSKKEEAWVILSWRVESLREKGHEWDVLLGFRSQKQANVAKATVAKLGIDVTAIADLEALDHALKAMAGRMFTLEVKQNGQYRNTYIDGPAGAPPAPEPEFATPEPVTAGDDGIPF